MTDTQVSQLKAGTKLHAVIDKGCIEFIVTADAAENPVKPGESRAHAEHRNKVGAVTMSMYVTHRSVGVHLAANHKRFR